MPKRARSYSFNRRGPAKRARDPQIYPSPYRKGYSYVARTPGGLMVTESKYFDTYKDVTAIQALTTSWAASEQDPATLNTLFAPQEGSDIDNRIGRKVSVYAIRIKGFIDLPKGVNLTSANTAEKVRLVLVQDTQTNGAQLAGEDVLAAPGTSDGGLALSTFINLANLGRFKILKDKSFSLSNPNMSWDGTNMEANSLARPFKMSVKFNKPVVVNFNNTNGGTVADIVDNSFHLICGKASSSLAPTISYQARICYKDR